ncbi:hypothetical protein GCM10028798_17370 [Humibacter antri]
MDDRRRLLERVYSREGAAEEPREYRDPQDGSTVRMTPSQWALAEYDRLHPQASDDAQGSAPNDGASHQRAGKDGATGRPGRGTGIGSDDPDSDRAHFDEAHFDEEDADDAGESREAGIVSRMRRAAPVLVAAAAFVLGVLVAVGVSSAVGRPAPSNPAAVNTPTNAPDDADWHPLPGPAVRDFLNSSPRATDLPAAVTKGFVPSSFHLIAGSVSLGESASIYAAERLNDQYCLVAVADGARVAETCGTLSEMAAHGLTLTKDAVRDVDGLPLAVTVTWSTDGTISWEAKPSVG